jgi:hypothetical protein
VGVVGLSKTTDRANFRCVGVADVWRTLRAVTLSVLRDCPGTEKGEKRVHLLPFFYLFDAALAILQSLLTTAGVGLNPRRDPGRLAAERPAAPCGHAVALAGPRLRARRAGARGDGEQG